MFWPKSRDCWLCRPEQAGVLNVGPKLDLEGWREGKDGEVRESHLARPGGGCVKSDCWIVRCSRVDLS